MTGLRRSAMRSRYRNTGPSPETVARVMTRDRDRCVVCGEEIYGYRGEDFSIQHRTGRGSGGTRRPWINLPSNLALMHGSGTTGCHGEVEANPTWAEEFGWRVKDGITLPSQVIMWHAPRGMWLYLDDLGGASDVPPDCPESAA